MYSTPCPVNDTNSSDQFLNCTHGSLGEGAASDAAALSVGPAVGGGVAAGVLALCIGVAAAALLLYKRKPQKPLSSSVLRPFAPAPLSSKSPVSSAESSPPGSSELVDPVHGGKSAASPGLQIREVGAAKGTRNAVFGSDVGGDRVTLNPTMVNSLG